MSTRTVAQYMTRGPRTVGPLETLEEAHRVMREWRIRHLPVLAEGVLQGVLSQRDLYLMETLQGVDPADVPVHEAMRADLLSVPPAAELEAVVAQMWRDKRGAVLVVEERRLLGIFTTSDALRALVELLAERRDAGGTQLPAP